MNFNRRNKISPNFNISSMTDVVFLLLIFFMIASTLAQQLNTIDIKLPQGKGKTENRKNISISIAQDNTYYIDSKKVSKVNLENYLLTELAKQKTKIIILRVAKSIPVQEVVYVMNIANKNSIKIVLAVKE